MVLTDAFSRFGRGLWQGLDLVPDPIPVAAQCLAETGGDSSGTGAAVNSAFPFLSMQLNGGSAMSIEGL